MSFTLLRFDEVKYDTFERYEDKSGKKKARITGKGKVPDVCREWKKGDKSKPTMIKLTITPGAKPGKRVVKLGEKGGESNQFILTVVDRYLPPAKDWKYFLDLWQHPWAVSRFFNVKPFSKEHYAKMERVWRALAEMRVADGKTMTISSPLILNGTLTKTGAGTLALGTHAVSSTTNKIVLSEGFLSATSTNDFNGVTVKMLPGTAIKVSLATDPATDLGRFGFFNVGTNTPFDLSDTDGKLQIVPDDPRNLLSSSGKIEVNLLTVSTTTADLLEGHFYGSP